MKTSLSALALALAFASAPAIAATALVPEDWSRADTARQVALTLTLAADASQTLDIKNYTQFANNTLHERNPVLGQHPSDRAIAVYFLAATALAYGTAANLPAGWKRQTFQYGTIALQLAVIARNRRIGMKFSF